MIKPNVLILGGGFAGLAAARILSKNKKLQVTLIDKKSYTDFLPLLPDLISSTVSPEVVHEDLAKICGQLRISFTQAEVTAIDLSARTIRLADGKGLAYDYLLIACGSRSNFHGNTSFAAKAYTLDSVETLLRLQTAVLNDSIETVIVSGGGYTGIEAATHVRKLLERTKKAKRVVLVEFADALLKDTPERLRRYILANLDRQQIEYILNDQLVDIDGQTVNLHSGKVFPKAMVIWSAGVQTPEVIQNLAVKKDSLGRLQVDPYLRIEGHVFVVGDCVYFPSGATALRMGVRFAVDEGHCAARNILHDSAGKPLQAFKPLDLGYIIPMANKKSCGLVLGIRIYGLVATLLHYFLSVLLNWGFKKRFILARQALRHILSRF